MAFGLSFGAKKNSSTQNSTINKNELTNQQTTGTKAQTGTTSIDGSQSSTGTTTGQQTTSQQGTNATTGSQVGTTTQTTSSFSNPVLSGIEAAIQGLLGKTANPAAASSFDAAAFVRDGTLAGERDVNNSLETNLNQIVSRVGGRAGANSMASILSSRLEGDAAAEKAGIRSKLTAEAEGIQRDNSVAASQVAGTDQAFLGNLLNALKGGQTTTTGVESTATSQNQTTNQTGTTNTAEQTAQNQTSNQVQTQNLLEALSQLLSGNTTTTGTEAVKATGKEMGGGFSLGF